MPANSNSPTPPEPSNPDGKPPVDPARRRRMGGLIGLYILLGIAGAWAFRGLFVPEGNVDKVSYKELVDQVRQDKVESAEIRNKEIIGILKKAPDAPEEEKPKRIVTKRLPRIDETELLKELDQHGVDYSGEIEDPSIWPMMLSWLLPIAVLIGVYVFFFRRMSRGRGSPMQFGKSRAKVYDESKGDRVTFKDVAGIDEVVNELREVVDFLKDPSKYRTLGAEIPKGVLLVGPPGTGKTLLARAVAGESGVPFFSISGSEFVEMFVGVGASRVRDLFEQAKERAPCIVFIDEIDAIGRTRGGLGSMATHDEREQTLNQILSEMDGFDGKTGVIIVAATNRPEVLDQALVRSGRFDRQVIVDRPDLEGRLAILKVHARKIPMGPDVNLDVIARRSPGMVGADLAKVINEAALAGARRRSRTVDQQDFEESLDRIQLGLKKSGRVMSEEEKRRVAFHESGHTLVAMSVENADPVHRVTIIPRSIGALGATLQLPTEDRYLMTKQELLDRIAVMLGGRAAEEVIFGDVSTGAQNDLERATETARQMICSFGMSETLGVVTYGRPRGLRFLDSPVSFGDERNFSEETALAIDKEVREIVDGARERALAILKRRRDLLDAITDRLLEKETLDKEELDEIAARFDGLDKDAASAELAS